MGCSTQKPKKDFQFYTIPVQQQPPDDLNEWTNIILKYSTKQNSSNGRPNFSKSKTMSARCHHPLEPIDEEEI